MSENIAIQSVQCSHCGAPLDLHGGHKVRSLVCGYCGSIMDAHKGYQQIKAYKNAGDRPISPFKLGMKGKIKGVEFTLIGMIEYDAEGSRWLDFQLFSPTHGYAWLSQDRGHYSFSRRIRNIPTPSRIKRFKQKKKITVKGKEFKLFERYTAKIVYVEGELTWIAQRGDKSKVVEAINPPYGFSYEQQSNELEYNWEEYLDTNTLFEDFGLIPASPSDEIHPLQVYSSDGFWGKMENISPNYFLISFLGLVVLWLFSSNTELLHYRHKEGGLATTQSFKVNSNNSLITLNLSAQPQKDSSWYEVNVLDQQEKTVFKLADSVKGQDFGQNFHWSQDAGQISAALRLNQGQYYLQIKPAAKQNALNLPKGAKPIPQAPIKLPAIQIKLIKEPIPLRFGVYLVLLSLLLLFISSYKHVSFDGKRWDDD